MKEAIKLDCICNNCKHLKSVIDEKALESNTIVETCEFGFPSDGCADCVLEGCELTCEHFEKAQDEEHYVIKHCAMCHKELKIVSGKSEDGEHFCVSCYLSKK